MKTLDVHGVHVVEFFPFSEETYFLIDWVCTHTHLGKIPWNAFMPLLRISDCTLQSTVGEGVALVELKVAFISEKTPTG